ncbi:glycosyltransferase family 39 protein [Spirosoma sp. KNUC1025]|uniref:ArnT family glycosyltransferase n=1 Tax=Spirosoma sp. KNUC1025 TaxID=2894082 RepID=UPI00386BC9AF|nr:hypothetical protein LN737_03280 [Spirosoma sp. KNUC1025]
MPFIIFSRRTYQLVFGLLSCALIWSFYNRAEYYDEAWFAEQSFWLIRDGQVRSELFRGYNGWEHGIYVFHKLFIYAGALVMHVTGISVPSNKIVSIFFGLAGGYLVWLYGRNQSREQQWLSVLLYFGCGTLIRFISVNRPETMCMALGFASYLALDPPKPSPTKPLLAGILAGLSALTHLNGLIYLVAGTIWLFLRKGWRPTIRFALAGSVTLSLYVLDALLDGQLQTLIAQFRDDPATQENMSLASKLMVMVDYHQIFFHSQNEAALSVLVLLCALAFRKYIQLTQPLLLYTILIIISFWLLTKSDTDIYYLLFVPWLAALAAFWLVHYVPRQPPWQLTVARIMLVGYSAIAITQFVYVINENRNTPDIEAHNTLLASHMPHRHTNVIAPIEFFFGQMDNYRIKGLTYYFLLEDHNKPTLLATFFEQANRDKVAYVISDHRLNASYEIPINAPARIGAYQRIFKDEWNSIYARQPDKNIEIHDLQ